MLIADTVSYALTSLRENLVRTVLVVAAMAIGVAAVVVLTALGEGVRRYVLNEFASLGSNLVIVMPGRSETAGAGLSALMGATPRELTLGDARALLQHASVERVAPLVMGAVEASRENRKREVTLMGSTAELLDLRKWQLSRGRFLPVESWERARPVCVIGGRIREELFGTQPALGQWIRLGENRFRVIGIMASEGRSIGIDVQDTVIVPVAAAKSLMNTSGLFRIFVETTGSAALERVVDFIERVISERHHGERDVTVVTQDAVVATFNRVLSARTYTLTAIASISLAVAGILVMNVMLVIVTQRTAEIGLLKALGATPAAIVSLVIGESILLSLVGGLLGLLIGVAATSVLTAVVGVVDLTPPVWALFVSLGVALFTGLVFSLIPARRAVGLLPVVALQTHR